MNEPKDVVEVLSNDPSEETNPPVPDESHVMIEDIDQFVAIVADWHGNRVAELEHMMTIPDGAIMIKGTEEIAVTGDYRAGFIAGIELALMRLGTLPFVAVGDNSESSEGMVTH